MKLLLVVTTLILGMQANAAQAAKLSLAKAAELGAHRVERLVTLRKIDETFLNKFQSIEVVALTQAVPTDPAFKATVGQVPGPDGTQSILEIFMDGAGKALSNTVKMGTEATTAPRWPEKDPVTLTENALHVVLEGINDPKIKPYYTGFKSLTVSQDRDATGQTIARFRLQSKEVAKVLEILLKTDGTVISQQITD